mgnify:CR=1 FL=1
MSGSVAFLISQRWRALRKATSSTPGKAWVITLGLAIFTPRRKSIVDRYGGHFPRVDRTQMRQLPGIGQYTANAVATFRIRSIGSNRRSQHRPCFGAHFQFANPIDKTAGREVALESRHAACAQTRRRAIYNSALVDLGALVSVFRASPNAEICPVRKFCRARNPETLPVKKSPSPRQGSSSRPTLLSSRQSKVLLAQSRASLARHVDFAAAANEIANRNALFTCRSFPFTHHRITLAVYRHRAPPKIFSNQTWFEISALENLAMPSPHRRAARHLLTAGRAARSHRQRVVRIVIGMPNRA